MRSNYHRMIRLTKLNLTAKVDQISSPCAFSNLHRRNLLQRGGNFRLPIRFPKAYPTAVSILRPSPSWLPRRQRPPPACLLHPVAAWPAVSRQPRTWRPPPPIPPTSGSLGQRSWPGGLPHHPTRSFRRRLA